MDNKDAYTILEFCQRHGISRASFYNAIKAGQGPKLMMCPSAASRRLGLPITRQAPAAKLFISVSLSRFRRDRQPRTALGRHFSVLVLHSAEGRCLNRLLRLVAV
jgi:hypothetical protein